MSSNCLVFHTSGGISSSPAAFLFLIFLRTESSSSCVNGPSLMSNCLLIILVIGSGVIFGGFPSKVATFNGNPRATIVSCYSPTNVSEENEIVTFYDELSSLVRSIPKHNMLVIGGDMNAQIGKNGNNKNSLHNTSNRNGQHLTDFMIENRLACLNTNYQKREGKLWTYTYANNTKAQIDYVLINKKWKNSALNCEAYSSFEGVSTDHRIVTAKIRLSLRKNDKRTATTKHYDWALLNNKDVRDKYVLELRNRFETLQEKTEKSTPNDEYENFVNAHLEAAAKYIPTKIKTKYRVPWETLAVREKRALVKTASKNYRKNPTNTNALKLKTAQYQLTGIYIKEQTEYIQNQIDKIRDSVEDRQSRIAWQTINEVSRRKNTAKAKLKAANQQERIKLWKQLQCKFLKRLYNFLSMVDFHYSRSETI